MSVGQLLVVALAIFIAAFMQVLSGFGFALLSMPIMTMAVPVEQAVIVSTLLGALAESIPPNERIITIEDTAELQIQIEDVVRMETRPPNIEGKGAITQRQLLMTALRLRPDRI